MQLLGVGSKMVKSIKHWLLTTGLAEEKKVKSKIELVITEELGEVINQYDPYFEDLFTLYILHVNIASHIDNATIWYLFFNKYDAKTFTKEDMQNVLDNELKKILDKDVTYLITPKDIVATDGRTARKRVVENLRDAFISDLPGESDYDF